MSIFGEIVNKLFGKAKPDQPPPAAEPTPDPAAAQAAARSGGLSSLMAGSGLRDFDAVVIQLVSVSFALARHVHGNGMPMN